MTAAATWSDTEARRQRSGGAGPSDDELLDALDAAWVEAPLVIGRDHHRFDFLTIGRIEQRDRDGPTTAWFGAHRFGAYRDPEVAASTVFRAWSRCCEIASNRPPNPSPILDKWVLPFAAGVFLASMLFSILLGASMIKLGNANPLLTECMRHLQAATHADQPTPPKVPDRASD
jgi:hypothetical protein